MDKPLKYVTLVCTGTAIILKFSGFSQDVGLATSTIGIGSRTVSAIAAVLIEVG